jgi:murein DD-endopeptidase MepM/ murein hydrolase activator NlpD
MRVFRFGNIIILIKDFRKFLLSFLAMLGVFVFSLVGGITYFYVKFFKRMSPKAVYENLLAENRELRETLKFLTHKLDSLYLKQRQLATVLNIPTYDISYEKLGIGGQIRDVDIDKITAYAKFQEDLLNKLEAKAKALGEEIKSIPSIPPVRGVFSSGFGIRRDPFTGGLEFHKGIDLSAPAGTPVVATADGRVEKAEWNSGGYGNVVVINHGRGIKTLYAHLSKILVREGQKVRRGQIIGLVGSTGKSVAPHVHYEVEVNGEAVNPIRYILVDGK